MAFEFDNKNSKSKSSSSRSGSSPFADGPGRQHGSSFGSGPTGSNHGFQSGLGSYSNSDSTGKGFTRGPSGSNGSSPSGDYGKARDNNATNPFQPPQDRTKRKNSRQSFSHTPLPPINIPWKLIIYVALVALIIWLLYTYRDVIAVVLSNLIAWVITIVILLIILRLIIWPPGRK